MQIKCLELWCPSIRLAKSNIFITNSDGELFSYIAGGIINQYELCDGLLKIANKFTNAHSLWAHSPTLWCCSYRYIGYLLLRNNLSPNIEAWNNPRARSRFLGVRNLGTALLGHLPHCLPQGCRQDADPGSAGSSEALWLLATSIPQQSWTKLLTDRWPTSTPSSLPHGGPIIKAC